MRSVGESYANEPLVYVGAETQADDLLGGEACMWGEGVAPATIESRIWPRTGAIAERLWSPKETTDTADLKDVYRRLEVLRGDLTQLGLEHDSYYERALAELTGGEQSPELRRLAAILEPPSILARLLSLRGLLTVFRPSIAEWFFDPPIVGSQFEDILKPESEIGRQFNEQVEEFLREPRSAGVRESIERQLRGWSENHQEMQDLLRDYSDLAEIEPVSKGVQRLSEAGLQALAVLDGEYLFSRREKELHQRLLDLYDPNQFELRIFDAPADGDMARAFRELQEHAFGLLLEKIRQLQPLVVFRIRIAVQPGIGRLIEAANARGEREDNVPEILWFVSDNKTAILVLAVFCSIAYLVFRRLKIRNRRLSSHHQS
jgi:hexosaminidase